MLSPNFKPKRTAAASYYYLMCDVMHITKILLKTIFAAMQFIARWAADAV